MCVYDGMPITLGKTLGETLGKTQPMWVDASECSRCRATGGTQPPALVFNHAATRMQIHCKPS